MTRRRTAGIALLVGTVLALGACAAGPNVAAGSGAGDPAGFWLGLWHGFISPITFLISLFDDDVNIYEVHNNGNWYDTGFMIGIVMVFSGSGHSGRRRRQAKPCRRAAAD